MFYMMLYYFNILIATVTNSFPPYFGIFATLNLIGICICLVAYVVNKKV